jgi:uncharacterized protein
MMTRWHTRYPAIAWIGPFVLFMALLVIMPALPIPQPWESIVRVSLIVASLWWCSRHVIVQLRVERPIASVLLGVAVWALWIAPDLLVSGWREHWLFQNALTGSLTTTMTPDALADPVVVLLRVARAAVLVPVLEELFWRGWLPRWLVNPDWQRVRLGHYTTLAFVGTALLFAAEHGPYWDVGLLCGVIYNGWMWRTKSLGDLVLTHAVTNACLSAYVLVSGRYEYWM